MMDSTDDAVVFNRISLLEPAKEQAIAWQGTEPRARGRCPVPQQPAILACSIRFSAQRLSPATVITSGQPMLAGEEIFPVIETVNALPEVVAALEKRGVSEGNGCACPEPSGDFF
ncbi:MAG: hypothetical protein CM15mP74_32040 [Halieaceae bacterium]|nr:MAG: hypothetical protein CM15mP74_32040 [Halieaceae bacterium]